MDAREARLAFGFLLLGLAPILATVAGAGAGIIVFAAGLLAGASAVA
jgi:nitrate reductase NapE component